MQCNLMTCNALCGLYGMYSTYSMYVMYVMYGMYAMYAMYMQCMHVGMLVCEYVLCFYGAKNQINYFRRHTT